jgi:hypothetical protein
LDADPPAQGSNLHAETQALAAVAMALRRGEARGNAECCPRCGYVLRIRAAVSDAYLAIVNRWLSARP